MWQAAMRVLRYLKGTIDVGITYRKENSDSLGALVDCGKGCDSNNLAELLSMGDADFAQDVDTRKSTTGYVVTYAGGAISWLSKLQPVVSQSTTEAEYIAVNNLAREVVWLQQLFEDMGIPLTQPVLKSDNNGCIAISRDPALHSRSKHIDVKYHYIRNLVLAGTVKIEYLNTKLMAADMFTKALPRDTFQLHCATIGLSTYVPP